MEIWNRTLENIFSNSQFLDDCLNKIDGNLTNIIHIFIENDFLTQVINSFINEYTSKRSFSKSTEKSAYFRKQGNVLYEKKDLEGSLIYYSKAVIYAEPKTLELANAYSNRSAALYHKQQWQACIEDICLSLNNGYPKGKQFKLYKRLAYCWLYLNNYNKANEILKIAESYVTLTSSDIDALSDIRSKLETFSSKQPILQRSLVFESQLNATLSPHKDLVFASCKVDLKVNEYSRSIITNCEIEPGDVLFIEPAYASVILQTCDEEDFICDFCNKCRVHPVPCDQCTDLVYCSEKCQTEAWVKYHQWECAGSQNGFWKELGIAHLATRIMIFGLCSLNDAISIIQKRRSNATGTIKNLQNAQQIILQLDSPRHKIYHKSLTQNTAEMYAFVFSLVTNVEHIEKEDLLKYCLTSVMIAIYLNKKTDLLNKVALINSDIIMSIKEWMILIAVIILHHICQLISNAHTINTHKETQDCGNRSYFTEVATALYPVISIMNHSCDPNIISCFSGNTQIVKARRRIHKGEEVFNCYGPDFRKMGFVERQFTLQNQYHFTCKCTSCMDPNYANIYETFSAYNCLVCKGPVQIINGQGRCKNCGLVDISDIINKMNSSRQKIVQFFDIIANKTKSEVKKLVCDICHVHEVCLYKHNTELLQLYGWISVIFAGLDMFEESIKYIKSMLEKNELLYGMNSIEVADCCNTYVTTLLKYLDFLKNNNESNSKLFLNISVESRNTMRKALFIYSLYFAEKTKKMENLQEKLSILN